jgi:hypothetical protein
VSVLRRPLADAERATVWRLYSSARLFDGDHVGANRGGADDLPFFILIVGPARGQGPAVALVVSGNASFDSGPRKALLDWMLQQRMQLAQ